MFRPQPTIYLLWAFGDEETRRVIEAAHERVLEWIEDEVAVIRYGKDGIYRVRPPGGLVAARFRHYEARSGRPLLHDHLLLSVMGQRLDGKWGAIHTTGAPGVRGLPATAALDSLLPAASRGPVVVVNVSRRRCDAVIVTEEGVRNRALPDLTLERATEWANTYLETLHPAEQAARAPVRRRFTWSAGGN